MPCFDLICSMPASLPQLGRHRSVQIACSPAASRPAGALLAACLLFARPSLAALAHLEGIADVRDADTLQVVFCDISLYTKGTPVPIRRVAA